MKRKQWNFLQIIFDFSFGFHLLCFIVAVYKTFILYLSYGLRIQRITRTCTATRVCAFVCPSTRSSVCELCTRQCVLETANVYIHTHARTHTTTLMPKKWQLKKMLCSLINDYWMQCIQTFLFSSSSTSQTEIYLFYFKEKPNIKRSFSFLFCIF